MKDNIKFLLSHPIDAVRAWRRQQMVKIDEQAPAGTIIEEFEEAPLRVAAKQMGLGHEGSGVQLTNWPRSVQTEMKAGKIVRPDGRHPEHPNV